MKRHWKIIALTGLLCMEGVMLFTLASVLPRTKAMEKNNTAVSSPAVSAIAGKASAHPQEAGIPASYDKKEVRTIYNKNKKTLVLVNGKKKIKKRYDPSLISISHGRLQASTHLYDSLVRMLADARKEGYQYFIASAYRSSEKQQKLIDGGIRKRMKMGLSYDEALTDTQREIMPAGHSEHETGLALDILCKGNMKMDNTQKSEPGNAWLQTNCYKYGFILRYPEKKENITGITYEPWHFRYVGERAATYMREENITLEEFWQRLGK